MKQGVNKKLTLKEVSIILFRRNKITAGLIYTSLLMNIFLWGGLLFLFKKGQAILIGHYNVFFGVDTFIDIIHRSNIWELFFPAIGGLFFLLLNIAISIFFILQLNISVGEEKKDVFISNRAISFLGSRLLLIGAWVLQLVLLVYLIAIYFINN